MTQQAHVLERYSAGAMQRETALCCPVDYDRDLLAALPTEIIEKDYGCGDPSRYVRTGDHVLDLGSGGGKICYMAAQLVGEQGLVIGVDMNDDMLALARRHQASMAERLGADRVSFRKGRIQDLALDLDLVDAHLREHPVRTSADLAALKGIEQELRRSRPLVADASVDLVISNCVLNLVDTGDREQLISEVFRVLKPGGRVAISDIVCDSEVPESLQADPELWSGCISGAYQERAFLDAFAAAGFSAVRYDKWDPEPWRVVDGIEFRSVTLTADKPAPARAGSNADVTLIYRGPYAEVVDELGHRYLRGERYRVEAAQARRLLTGALESDFIVLERRGETSIDLPVQSPCGGGSCC